MPLSSVQVSIANNGAENIPASSCGRLYLTLRTRAQVNTVAAGGIFPTGADAVPLLRALADTANDLAGWLVLEMNNHAQAKVPAGTGGIQRTPNPNNAATDCDGPTADVFLAIE